MDCARVYIVYVYTPALLAEIAPSENSWIRWKTCNSGNQCVCVYTHVRIDTTKTLLNFQESIVEMDEVLTTHSKSDMDNSLCSEFIG